MSSWYGVTLTSKFDINQDATRRHRDADLRLALIVGSVSADEQPSSGVGPAAGGPAGAGTVDGAYRGLGGARRQNTMALLRIVVAVLGVILVVGSAVHIAPAIRAGLREGTRGYWVVTGRTCSRKVCVWVGKFVLPDGHVQLARAQYTGSLPASIHVGTRIQALAPGGGLVFPSTGSDLWISMVVGLAVGLIALYWAGYRWLAAYLRQRADTPSLAAPLR